MFRKNYNTHQIQILHKRVEVGHSLFVDDAMTMDKSAVGARISGDIVTATLGELSLAADSSKTVQVVCGEEKAVEELKKDIKTAQQ